MATPTIFRNYYMGEMLLTIQSKYDGIISVWTRCRDNGGDLYNSAWPYEHGLSLARYDALYFFRKPQKRLRVLRTVVQLNYAVGGISSFHSWVQVVQSKEIEAGAIADPCGSGQGRGTVGSSRSKTGEARQVPKEKVNRWKATIQQAKGVSLGAAVGHSVRTYATHFKIGMRYHMVMKARRQRRNNGQ